MKSILRLDVVNGRNLFTIMNVAPLTYRIYYIQHTDQLSVTYTYNIKSSITRINETL